MTIRLQTCKACGAYQYPDRDVCRACLHDGLEFSETDGRGLLRGATTLHRSLDPEVSETLPLRIGSVALDVGVRVIAFVGNAEPGERVVLHAATDTRQRTIFTAEKDPSDA